MPGSPVRSVVIGSLVGLLCAVRPAAAIGAAAVAEAFVAAAGAVPGVAVTYSGAAGDGETVTISGVSATFGDATATLPNVVVSGIAPREGGGMTAARIAFDGGSITDPRGTLRWTTAAVEDAVIPLADEVKARARIRPFRALSMTALTVEAAALAAPIEIAASDVEVDEIADGIPANARFHASGVRLPTALIANTVLGVMATMMNYTEFVADISVDGVYDGDADSAVLEMLTIDVPTAGKLAVAAEASDFSIRNITDPDEEVSKEARAKARLESVQVRIENTGIVERFLDMQAQMLGGSRDDVRKQIVEGALPFALSFVKNVAFREEFQAAVAAFLNEPRSLTITAEPGEPVPLGQFVRAAARAPMTLPDLLAPRVEANN
jgi:hypothetical protein